jgi:hypothetical protein
MKPADSVVCRNAEYRLEVDGRPFPWHIDERGPRFTRLLDDLYRVDLTVLCVRRDRSDDSGSYETFDDSFYGRPIIAGLPFPWEITSEGVSYNRSRTTIATVRLAFFAKDVDTDGEVFDVRRHDHTIHGLNGDLYHESARDKALGITA